MTMSKFQDMKSYYSLVKAVCCFEDPVSSESSNLYNMKLALTRGLPEDLAEIDFSVFREIYCDYRLWILQHYIDPYYQFASHYHPFRYYHPRNGFDSAKQFKEEYGGLAEEYIFLATTMADYFEHQFETFRRNARDKNCDIVLLCEVAHKLYYGCLLLMKQIGYKKTDGALDWELIIIKNKRGHEEKMIRF